MMKPCYVIMHNHTPVCMLSNLADAEEMCFALIDYTAYVSFALEHNFLEKPIHSAKETLMLHAYDYYIVEDVFPYFDD